MTARILSVALADYDTPAHAALAVIREFKALGGDQFTLAPMPTERARIASRALHAMADIADLRACMYDTGVQHGPLMSHGGLTPEQQTEHAELCALGFYLSEVVDGTAVYVDSRQPSNVATVERDGTVS